MRFLLSNMITVNALISVAFADPLDRDHTWIECRISHGKYYAYLCSEVSASGGGDAMVYFRNKDRLIIDRTPVTWNGNTNGGCDKIDSGDAAPGAVSCYFHITSGLQH